MQEVQMYDRDLKDGALKLRGGIYIGSGLDNIDVDEDGSLWLGAHPNLLALTAVRDDPKALSPSQAVRVSFVGDGAQIDEIFLDRGDRISGVSVAARYGKRLLLGQIFGDGILDCTMR
jgi:arylesterase/paraoxonase